MIAVGRFGRPHGVRGEVKLRLYFGLDSSKPLVGKTVYLQTEGTGCPEKAVIRSVRLAGDVALVSLEGIATPEEALIFADQVISIPRSQAPDLPQGKYYYEEVVGLPVYDPQGSLIGRLTGFFEAGSADVWVITSPAGEEILTPCLPETLISVDLEKGRIVMRLMESE